MEFEYHANVTRIEVIDDNGRVFTWYGEAGVYVQPQDDGRTLKLFAGTPDQKMKL